MIDTYSTNQEFQHFSPLLNWILAKYQSSSLPGKYRLYKWLLAQKPGWLISHSVKGRHFSVPVDEWCFWQEKGPQNYYLREFLPLCELTNQLDSDFLFFDLGADIGTVSSLVHMHCPRAKGLIGFEPNPSAFKVLTYNFEQIGPLARAENTAVSNFNGEAFFSRKAGTVDHEGHLISDKKGEAKVVMLDSWVEQNMGKLLPTIVLKIDVEGQELNVIEGAKETIKSAQKLITMIEIHPDVMEDQKLSPEQIFRSFENFKDMYWLVPYWNKQVDRGDIFFNQFPRQQYDVIGISSNVHFNACNPPEK